MERVLFAPRELPPLSPDVSQDSGAYASWVREREEERRRTPPTTNGPILGLVMVIPGAPPSGTARTLRSLHEQTSGRWSLTVAATEPWLDELCSLVAACLPWRMRRRVRTVAARAGTPNRNLVGQGLAVNRGSPVALIFPGDVWAPDGVALLSTALTPMGVVYADEDQVTVDGTHQHPRLKPDFSSDFLFSSAYIGRPLAIGSEVAKSLPDFIAHDTIALEHECALSACDVADTVTHIAEVLCHRSEASDEESTGESPVDHVREALRRRDDPSEVIAGSLPGTYRILRRTNAGKSVSILVPLRDEPRFLRTCVDSVTATTLTDDIEFILIDNGSSDPETLTLLERFDTRSDIRVLRDTRPFNWAQLNNAGAQVARGDVLMFLNNDIEAHREGWLSALIAHALRPDVGAVGARLLYPDRRVQHCGIVVGLTGAAGHPLIGLPEGHAGYMNMALVTRECSAVTGACLAARREVFDLLHGFDETLGVDLNDVDFCLRARASGYRTIYEPAAELIHYESPSRGSAGGAGDVVTFITRWKDYIIQGDPYFNEHLTRADPSCGLARAEEEDTWRQWYSTLAAH